MSPTVPQTLILTLTLCLIASAGVALAKEDYIDLLQLRDNDEFLWGPHQNAAKAGDAERAAAVEGAFNYTRTKRQATATPPALQENKDFGACSTPGGEAGRCRHLIYCRIPELKNDVWKLVSQLCVIEKSSIGICCPLHVNSRASPQIISDVTDNSVGDGTVRVVNHPEQRGCGISTKQFPRVTGGRPAEPDEWPWMAALLQPGLPFVWCGGVLVTDRHVLTAAHCIYKMTKEQFFVRLGEYDTHELNETRARDFRVAAMVTHIDYNPYTFENDIALVRVERPTLFNTYIWPVCMPPITEEWEGRVGVVTGWGTQAFGGVHSPVLMEVLLPVWKHADCKRAMIERVPDTVLCAGVPTGGQDSCQGDSGGPLLVQLPNNRWVSIGIVSWGVHCGEPNRPGIYTRVDRYLHWIIENSDI